MRTDVVVHQFARLNAGARMLVVTLCVEICNLIALCPHHHRLHHQGKLGITGNADLPGGVVFTDADGRVITASGAKPKPPGAAPPPITGTYQHPLGQRLDMKWVSFGTPPGHHERMRADEPRRPADIAWP